MRPQPSRSSDRPHLLVVDDEPDIRDLLREVLLREGYRVTLRSEAQDALEEMRRGAVHLLITDLRMPRMSGLDLIRTAKGLQPDMGSILITGFASTETAVQALRLGADDYVPKPFRAEELLRVVDRVLGKSRMLGTERDALDRARDEAEAMRVRSRSAEAELAETRRDLDLSRETLARRVKDLDFVGQLTALLAKERDLDRVLDTTARILAARFQALVVRIEVALASSLHAVHHLADRVPGRHVGALRPDLVSAARRAPDRIHREVVLGMGVPLEALATPLDLGGGAAGGITLLRRLGPETDEADRFLLGLVPRALAVGVEAELQRRHAARGALDVATRMLEALEGRGTLHRGHADRVGGLARRMAGALGLSPRLQEVIHTAARLHDVGQVGIPDTVLTQEGPLSAADRQLLHEHPVLGARILAPFGEAAAFVRYHHERPDGTGYPDGLEGEAIPLGAGIVGVAEAYDAMTHPRSYRASLRPADALGEIRALRGTQFVAQAVDALLNVKEETSRW